MKFTQIPTNTFKELQLNAGILLTAFEPSTATVSNEAIFGATSGGCNFTDVPEYIDFGEDIDNCPKNTKELKKINKREVKITGTFASVNENTIKSLVASADVAKSDVNKITPRDVLKDEDFADIWWVGDYSDNNGNTNGGFIAIHLMNALSTGGFSLQTTDKEKGQFAFEYSAHYTTADVDKVPYEVYVKAGSPEA